MKKGISSCSIPKHVTFAEMFCDLSAAGFDGVELNLREETGGNNHVLTFNSGKCVLDKINNLSEKYNLKIASIIGGSREKPLGSNDREIRELGKDIIRKLLEYAKALGADSVLVVPGGMDENTSLSQAYENSFIALEELKPEIEDAKIYVGLENVGNGFFTSAFDMKNFIDKLDCKYIKAYFDVGNVMRFSNPEYWINILGSRICKVHVKDFAGGRGGISVNLLQGDIDWKRVLSALRAVGYDSYLTAELKSIEACPKYLYQITSKALDIMISGDYDNL